MYFEELKTGMQVQIAPVTVQKEEMLGFSARYDNVPLHTDEAYAEQTHFGQLLAPGMLSFLLIWASYLRQDFFGEELLAGVSQKVEWHKPVFAGDVLNGTAEITALTDRSPKNGLAQLTITACNQNGQPVLIAVTECIVKKMPYRFYGWQTATVPNISGTMEAVTTPQKMYEMLRKIWCQYTCAPRLRDKWSPENPTLGQCSITAFLVQDLFGGKVYGILRPGGNYHCYNVIGDAVFDLTSEQFGEEILCYENNPEQFREVHFARQEKRERYEYLKAALQEALSRS
ncbi:MAG: MaoC family dehydratase N-terminal domain-containing protein [Oscillospiraceae bacterium]|nr:MaoC family dehydratase N-terminal domain-containing protein [Oscillospiraceae bacterium]